MLWKQLASFGHEGETEIGNRVWRPAAGVSAGKGDAPPGRCQQTGEATHGRSLAGAVAAKHEHNLAGLDREGNALHHLERAVRDVEVADLKQGHRRVPNRR